MLISVQILKSMGLSNFLSNSLYRLHKFGGYQHTDRPTCAKQYAPPSLKGSIKISVHQINGMEATKSKGRNVIVHGHDYKLHMKLGCRMTTHFQYHHSLIYIEIYPIHILLPEIFFTPYSFVLCFNVPNFIHLSMFYICVYA